MTKEEAISKAIIDIAHILLFSGFSPYEALTILTNININMIRSMKSNHTPQELINSIAQATQEGLERLEGGDGELIQTINYQI